MFAPLALLIIFINERPFEQETWYFVIVVIADY